MKKSILIQLFTLLTLVCYSQQNLNNGFTYSFVSGIPAVEGITTKFNDFEFNDSLNHFLDQKSGSVVCMKDKKHNIEIELNNIGRFAFYTKTKLNVETELNASLGNYNVNFYRDEELIKSEKRDLSQNWTEFHYNINEYKINKITVAFNPSIDSSIIAIDKIRVQAFTKVGVKKLKEQFEQNELLHTVSADIKSQKSAIKNLSINNIKTLIYFKRKLDDVNTFIEGEKLGTSRQKALNPFTYPEFDQSYKEIVVNASRAEQLKLKELKGSINKNNWVNVVGNITDVLTGGMFSSLLNSLRNIINNGATIGGVEVIVINGKLYKLHKGKLEIIPPGSQLDVEYTKIHKKYSGYIKFIEILSSKQLIEINEEEKFDIKKEKADLLKIEINSLLSHIISNADLTIEDGFFKGELDSETLISKFRKNFTISESAFLNYKIKSEINNTKTQNISSSFYEFIAEFKTHYDTKYSEEKLNPDALFDLNINSEIKKDWKRNLEKIAEQYINSTELKKLKDLTNE